jgi:hypothetical protein
MLLQRLCRPPSAPASGQATGRHRDGAAADLAPFVLDAVFNQRLQQQYSVARMQSKAGSRRLLQKTQPESTR